MDNSRLIFIVDDDKAILNVFEYTLGFSDDWTIKTFSSGEDCIKELDANPDIIILDYQLAEGMMNGVEVMKKLHAARPDLKVIVLSLNDDEKIKKAFFENGATTYIIKEEFFVDNIITEIDRLTKIT